MTTDFVRLQTIIPDYKRLIGSEEIDNDVYGGISENDILAWGHDGTGLISTATQKVQRIMVVPIDQYRGKLPKGFLAVIQAAYRENPEKPCIREQVVQWTQETFDKSGCKIVIDLDCPACSKVDCTCNNPIVEVDVNRIYQEAHPEYYYGYMRHFYAYGNTFNREQGCAYTNEFRLMRRTSNTFYGVPYHIGECVNFYVSSPVEYDIDFAGPDNLYISTSFKKGEVLLSYMSEKTDELGYRMVPNTPKAIEAVLHYIDERMAYKAWRRSGDPSKRVDWQILNGLRSEKIGKALAELKMPDQDKWKNFLATTWKQSIPFWHYDKSRNLYNPRETDNGHYWGMVRPDYNFNY